VSKHDVMVEKDNNSCTQIDIRYLGGI